MESFDSLNELGACSHLFLEELIEPETNRLRIRVVEGQVSKTSIPIEVAGNSLGEGFPVKVTSASVRFELVWQSYVLYQVTNESYGAKATDQPTSAECEGAIAIYTSSRLLSQVAKTTNASDDYPGKLVHCQLICSDHIIDVVSIERPACRRISLPGRVN